MLERRDFNGRIQICFVCYFYMCFVVLLTDIKCIAFKSRGLTLSTSAPGTTKGSYATVKVNIHLDYTEYLCTEYCKQKLQN